MSRSNRTFSDDFRLLNEQQRRMLKSHPSPKKLLAYYEGTLDTVTQERLQDHLALCETCMQAVLDMTRFPNLEPTDPDRALSDAQVKDAFTALNEEISVRTQNPIAISPKRRSPSNTIAWSVAAVFFMTTVTFAFWTHSLLPYTQPEINAEINTLESSPKRNQTKGEAVLIQFAARQKAKTLALLYYDDEAREFDDYSVKVENAKGKIVWFGEGFAKSDEQTFNLKITRRFLHPGEYRFILYGALAGEQQQLAAYPVIISHK